MSSKKVTVSAVDFAKRIAELEGQLALIKSTLVVAPVAPKKTKVVAKSAKPTTRTEAVAVWKEVRGITESTQVAYKAIYAAKFAKDWADWMETQAYKTSKGAERKFMNRQYAIELRNSYRAKAGMNKLSFE
jgi:hypothetical protein